MRRQQRRKAATIMPSGSSSLVFINYSDPARDRKQKNHRHIVTKCTYPLPSAASQAPV